MNVDLSCYLRKSESRNIVHIRYYKYGIKSTFIANIKLIPPAKFPKKKNRYWGRSQIILENLYGICAQKRNSKLLNIHSKAMWLCYHSYDYMILWSAAFAGIAAKMHCMHCKHCITKWKNTTDGNNAKKYFLRKSLSRNFSFDDYAVQSVDALKFSIVQVFSVIETHENNVDFLFFERKRYSFSSFGCSAQW